ncbi:DeoR/GlpR transcriptional regulator [Microbacterium lushaniae]|nr:DeoR/GlpR transcriptional regulator [Microbacterium lushaniae]KAA9150542.1 DeoR/GlpR transcriptional regulator [Microbacterium lushaniae]
MLGRMSVSGTVESQNRRAALLELADSGATVRIDEAAERFGVSPMTIRRDLADLESSGRLRRVRGGAIAAPTPQPFHRRRTLNVAAKRVIARKALTLVPASGTIALDASSTISLVAATLGARSGLTVFTNSVDTFALLAETAGVSPLLAGGSPEPTTGSLTGPLAVGSIRSLYFDLALTSADAVDPGAGTSEVSLAEAEVKRALVEQASRCVVAVDSTKLGRRSVAAAVAMEHVDALITELDPADERLAGFRGVVELL